MDTEIHTQPLEPYLPEEEAVPQRAEKHRRRDRRYATLAMLLAVTAVAAGLRFYHLSRPDSYVFDEVYYAKDGCFDAGIDFRECELDGPREQTIGVHPPIGRELIALGIRAYGNRPFGWRVATALAGTVSVLLLSLLALRLFGSVLWAGAAGLLLATENLSFVQSRTSMLDGFIPMFVIAGFLFLVLDKQWMERREHPPERLVGIDEEEARLFDLPPDRPPSPVLRPWRIAAGAALGLAVATKWSGGTALVGAILLTLGWERTRRARAGLRHPLWEAIRSEGFGIMLFLLVLPLAVYMASYVRWFGENGFDLARWLEVQQGMATFSLGLEAEHPYASRPWQWPLMLRPVAYYYKSGTPEGTAAHILGMGNPAVFWGGTVALVVAAASWLRALGRRRMVIVAAWTMGATAASVGLVALIRLLGPDLGSVRGREVELLVFVALWSFLVTAALSDQRHGWLPGFVVTAFGAQYIPWFATGRTSFFFYMTPIAPFMVLALVWGLWRMARVELGETRSRALAPAAVMVVVVCVAVFLFFFPVLTGRTISHGQWQARMWMGCTEGRICIGNWV